MGFFSRKAKPSKEESSKATSLPSQTLSAPGADLSGESRSASSEDVMSGLCECVVRLSEGKLARETIDPRAHIFDFGYVDSFKSAELLVFIQKHFGVEVPEVQLVGRLSNLEALAKFIEEKR
jgi:acyl carrier protein